MSQRMIDRLFTEGALELNRSTQRLEPWSLDALRDGGAIRTGRRLFDDAEVLVVDNVTKYLYEVCEQEIWDGAEYPNCAPPFPTFWMETRAPAYSRSGKTIYRWQGQHAWGALFAANEIPADLTGAFASPDVQHRLEEEKRLAWHSVVRAFDFHGLRFPATAPDTDDAGRTWVCHLTTDLPGGTASVWLCDAFAGRPPSD